MNETNKTTLPIHITPHHLSLSPALSEFVHSKFAKVPRFASDVLSTEVVLRRHHGTSDGKLFSASGRLALAGRDIHATASHADLYTAIIKLVARLTRRSRKRKTRMEKTYSTRRRIWNREISLPASPRIEAPELSEDETRSSRRRAGGQEQRVFRFRRSAPFAFHQT